MKFRSLLPDFSFVSVLGPVSSAFSSATGIVLSLVSYSVVSLIFILRARGSLFFLLDSPACRSSFFFLFSTL
jgi:hypothetical protein